MKYRWKNDKTEVRVRKFGTVYHIATGGDFRKGYITFSEKEFIMYFEPIK